MRIAVNILGTKTRQRYGVRRLVTIADSVLRSEHPGLDVEFLEVKTGEEIYKYISVQIAPGLVINEKPVYDLWIPSKEQVIGCMREAIAEMQPV